ncbi:hypothetical protein [Pseudoalteromonas rhizosphaerae]|uniref:hypothetical protein n=1 Tax=Pseudoalteromonas rhizosphaerae TaxID=2518973 RepID=UPI0021479487|nr:hypothetical protein [Pseudoalteromonas rhizosphaerae]
MKLLILISFFLILCGCSSSTGSELAKSSKQVTANVNGSGYKCEQEIITGTKFKKKRCRTHEQIKEDEAQAKELLRARKNSAGVQVN